MERMTPIPRFEDALIERGYTPLICVGFGQRPDGTYSIKLAAAPVIRSLDPKTWSVMRQTIIGAIDQLISQPLDDLEIE